MPAKWETDAAFCQVKATTLGYYPNEGVNYFLAVGFGLSALSTLVFGVWKRTWGFSLAVAAGCILECAGYAGRVQLHANPCNGDAFKTQIVAIVLGPTIICIGLYLTLKHIANAINPSLSRISPRWFPLIFVVSDVSCLVVQAAGGGVAAAATTDGKRDINLLTAGNRAIIAGICLQVAVLAGFGLVVGDYLIRARRWVHGGNATGDGLALWNTRHFKVFLYAIGGAYSAITIRCIYRIAEMAGGWGNHIMQDEPSFVVLESFMILIACALLSAFPPGVWFPQMSHRRKSKQVESSSVEQSELENSPAKVERDAVREV